MLLTNTVWHAHCNAQVFNYERFIIGSQRIKKWNGNNGFVNFEVTDDAVQAFSHWTWHVSNNQVMVVDIQGIYDPDKKQYLLFDPAIHSSFILRFGDTNRGIEGMQVFFVMHKCNCLCRRLGLKTHPAQPAM
jgi:hypothetical protein